MTRFVATYASAGEGHRRAAEAVAAAVPSSAAAAVELRDCLEGSAAWFRWTYTDGYLAMVRHVPWGWGMVYQTADWWGGSRGVRALRRWGNHTQGRPFEAWLLAQQPDVVIATHFYPVEVVATLKRSGRLRSRLLSVITDWLPHAFWIAPGVDRYAVASEPTRLALQRRGVPPAQITVTGIPIDQRFGARPPRPQAAAALGIDPARFTLLVGSGGFGIGPVLQLVQQLGRVPGPCHVLVVAGRNAGLQRSLARLRAHFPHPLTVYGFVENMHELMAAADLLISKPGGLTCAEAMASGLPMLVVAPIPGQEARNGAVLAGAGAARSVRRLADLPGMVAAVRDPVARAPLLAAVRGLARPHAAGDIVALAQELAS